MTNERKFEIAYLLLVQQLQRDGIMTNDLLKQQLDNASETLGIPQEEMDDFAVLIAQDTNTIANAAPV